MTHNHYRQPKMLGATLTQHSRRGRRFWHGHQQAARTATGDTIISLRSLSAARSLRAKSSVLESIIQVPFPRGEGTCTRYVTKVTMEYRETYRIEVRIHPGEDRESSRRGLLSSFKMLDDSSAYAHKLGEFMGKAHNAIFRDTDVKRFTKDVMLVTVSDPTTGQLQVLDLPGLYRL